VPFTDLRPNGVTQLVLRIGCYGDLAVLAREQEPQDRLVQVFSLAGSYLVPPRVVADLLPKEANINVEAGEAFVELWRKISDGLGDDLADRLEDEPAVVVH
jgi:hypothetical protein